jgi:hypothetical protein
VRLAPFGLFIFSACQSPADSDRAVGCDPIEPLHFPGGAGSAVLEGTVPRGGRTCWTVHLEAGRRLDVRLTSPGGDAAVEVLSRGTLAVGPRSSTGSFASSSVASSSSSLGGSVGGSETRVSIGPQSPGGEVLIAVAATRAAAASYRLEVTLR